MRALVYSHAYVAEANHAKLERLAKGEDVDLALVCPRRVRRELMTLEVQRAAHGDYTIVTVPGLYHSHTYRFFYWGAGPAIRRLAPDLLHIEEEPWSLAAWQAVRAVRRRPETKIVVFTWQNQRRSYGWPHDRIERTVLAAAHAAVAGNAEGAEILREKGFEKPVHVLPQFGVDETLFTPSDEAALRKELGLTGFIVGFAGRLVPEKGVDLLLEALEGLEGDWSLLLVGRGALRGQLADRLDGEPFADRSVLLDTVSHEAMPRYLNAMDCLVLPSRQAPHWQEQFGHVLIEAMACEVPVVGSTCGAIPEVIGDAGLLFPEGDAAALGGVLESLMASSERRGEWARRGRERVIERYTHDRIADATLAIWREVLAP
jgi:glycosyltransferase involved in cell wall biosynthesis